MPAPAVVPRGQQFQFTKEEFSNFHDDHWMQNPENNPELTRNGAHSSTGAQSIHSQHNAPETDISERDERRFGQFINDQIKNDLLKQVNDKAPFSP